MRFENWQITPLCHCNGLPNSEENSNLKRNELEKGFLENGEHLNDYHLGSSYLLNTNDNHLHIGLAD